MSDDMNELMRRMEEINSKPANGLTSVDIDTIIAYHRHQRMRKASGEKVVKPKVDISAITKKLTKPTGPAITRRV